MIEIKEINDYRLYVEVQAQDRGMYMMKFLNRSHSDADLTEISRFFLLPEELKTINQYVQQFLTQQGHSNEN